MRKIAVTVIIVASGIAFAATLAPQPRFAHDSIRSVTFEKAECEVDAGISDAAPKFYDCVAMRTNACAVIDGGTRLLKECHESVKMLLPKAPIVQAVAKEASADWR